MRLNIYVPPELAARIKVLPPRSLSRICQRALEQAVDDLEEKAAAEGEALRALWGSS